MLFILQYTQLHRYVPYWLNAVIQVLQEFRKTKEQAQEQMLNFTHFLVLNIFLKRFLAVFKVKYRQEIIFFIYFPIEP